MKYTQANFGRVFVLRLEHGDEIPNSIEKFAIEHNIKSAIVHFMGGADANSKVVVGPKDGNSPKPNPMITNLSGVSEAIGFGTIFSNDKDIPKLHLHSAFGRRNETITGCTREGVDIWHIGEVIILELIDLKAKRKIDSKTGFELLDIL
ncbi:MAG: PPC domain-containing DNA-binding protein [bacterium]